MWSNPQSRWKSAANLLISIMFAGIMPLPMATQPLHNPGISDQKKTANNCDN